MTIAYGLIFALSLIMPPLYFAFIALQERKDEKTPCGILISCLQVKTVSHYSCRGKSW